MNIENVRVKGRGAQAEMRAHVIRKLHSDANAPVSLRKVTSGHYWIRTQASGKELLGAINLPDFTHLGKCVTDLEVAPLAGALAMEEKN
ncbi:MAG: hypothetical protein WBS24_12025 [Terriglobales bacterium]